MQAEGHFYNSEASDDNQAFTPDLYASSVARLELRGPLSVLPSASCEEGDVVLVRVKEVNTAYPNLETAEVREVVLERGNLLVGVLGSRKALRGFSGKPPRYLRRGSLLHLLNKGGIIGECTAAGIWLMIGILLCALGVPYRPINVMPR